MNMRSLINLVEAALDEDAAQTPEFQRWFAGSKIVDVGGRPLRVFHGTQKQITGDLRPGARGMIFFSTDPQLAAQFAGWSEHRNPNDPPDPLVRAAGGHIFPAYLRGTNPFDPQNKAQAMRVWELVDPEAAVQEIIDANGSDDWTEEEVFEWFSRGDWIAIELPSVMRAVHQLGHDAIWVHELGIQNIAVFSDRQVWPALKVAQ